MKLCKLILMLVFTFSFLFSCGGSDGGSGGGGEQPEEETTDGTDGGTTGGTSGGTDGGTTGGTSANFDVILDSELTEAERTSVNNSIDLLESLQIDGSRIAGFSEIFGGNRSSNVVSYLERRVNYITSQFTPPFSRLELPPEALAISKEYLAENLSVLFWYADEYYASQGGARYVISGSPRDINSSHLGVIHLGDVFTPSDAITQAITYVHEARHSDCPEGALLSDIVNFVESGITPQNLSCGQFHTSSIDTFPWGAYAIDYIYSLAIFETCSNCTETQKQQALGNANQVQGSAFDINGTMNGVYGDPDMGNSTRVRNDL